MSIFIILKMEDFLRTFFVVVIKWGKGGMAFAPLPPFQRNGDITTPDFCKID